MKRILFFIATSLLLGSTAFAQNPKVITSYRCYLLTDKYDLSELYDMPVNQCTIGSIPKNKELNVLEIDTIHYIFLKVQYKQKTGWIHKDVLVDKTIMRNPKIRHEFRDLISQHKIAIGMNKDEVIESWGYPPQKNTTVTSDGTSEQWVFSVEKNKYVYFDDGFVSAMQF